MDMDIGRLPSGNTTALKQSAPSPNFIDLTSDGEEGDDGPQVLHTTEDSARLHDAEDNEVSAEEYEDGEDCDPEDVWAVSSFMEDAVEALAEQDLIEGPDVCSVDEAQEYRRQLRELGPEEFFRRTVEADEISAKKLLTAFRFKPPVWLDGCPDEAYYSLLSAAVSRELDKRMKLPQYNTIDDAVELLKKSKNIIVITGAGISTSLGIPDFRSKDVGLYATLQEFGLEDPQQVFDIETFRDDPNIFFAVAKRILPESSKFSPTHAFIRLLQDKDKLLTNYSQNIDNLEEAAGVRAEKLIQCHGSFATATCQKCRAKVPGSDIFDDIKNSRLPRCIECTKSLQVKPTFKRKISSNGGLKKKKKRWNGKDDSDDDESDYNIPEAGIMKPDITFFGEALSDAFHDRLTKVDRNLVDLVVVIGTSLKVAPVSEIIPFLSADTPQMYISREPVKHIDFDIDLLGDCDVVVAELCRRAGWDLNHEMIPENQKVSVTLEEGYPSRYVFKQEEDTKVDKK